MHDLDGKTPIEQKYQELAKLVQRVAVGGDNHAVELLYHQLRPLMKIFLVRRASGEFEDVLQESFYTLIVAIKSNYIDKPTHVTAYLRTIMLRKCQALYLRASRFRELTVDVPQQVLDLGATSASVERYRAQLMETAMAYLRPQEREILERFYLNEEAKDDITEQMGLTPTQFRLLKSRAKKKLAEEIKKLESRTALRKMVGTEGLPITTSLLKKANICIQA